MPNPLWWIKPIKKSRHNKAETTSTALAAFINRPQVVLNQR
tara:strand:+ start:402 stop:524 length:123 start_codon:yes stop_codon:yes gene_type:complete